MRTRCCELYPFVINDSAAQIAEFSQRLVGQQVSHFREEIDDNGVISESGRD